MKTVELELASRNKAESPEWEAGQGGHTAQERKDTGER